MYYLEYHHLLKKYKQAENNYYNALDKQNKLLYNVLPHAVENKEVINHLNQISYDTSLIDYADKIKDVDNLVNETRNTKDMLAYELKDKEKKLRQSKDIYDKVYVLKWMEHKKPKYFCRSIGYSRRQVYRFIDEIKKNMAQNGTKIDV